MAKGMQRKAKDHAEKNPVVLALIEVQKTKKAMKAKAHEFMCHGFISHVEYMKIIDRIGVYYAPMINGFKKIIRTDKELTDALPEKILFKVKEK
ncbi:MAG: hypothetical protein GY797_36275 [Deltaproteobacteria bacterium]|nr:hypothetical protein [Deltaproteobacteria bacterium]